MRKINPYNVSKKMYCKNKMNIINKFLLFTLLLIILFVGAVYLIKYLLYPLAYFDIVKVEATKNNIDPYLIMAVIKTESNFNKKAVSNKNAKGLMQIMDSTAQELKNNISDDLDMSDIYNIDVNIALGSKYLSSLINKYNGNYYLAICAYNAGMGNVNKWLEQGIISSDLNEYKDVNIPFPQTKDYLYKVIKSYKMYRIFYE